MNILCDEGMESHIVWQLRQDRHSVLYVAEMEPGIDDETVLKRANEKGALLITKDKDFGELVYRKGLIHLGVVLTRLDGFSLAAKAHIVSAALAKHGGEMAHSFTVISPGMVRIRHKVE